MSDHPIEALMKTAMESIKEMVDVNTVVGDPVETPDGSVIIPVSRVTAGFAAGGGEYEASQKEGGGGGGSNRMEDNTPYPFGGGSGAGVSVRPLGFLVSSGKDVRLLPIDNNAIWDHLIDTVPKMFDQVKEFFGNGDKTVTVKTDET